MSYKAVIVAEKNSVARAIASFLGGSSVRRFRVERVPAYEFLWEGGKHLSIGVSGHILDFDFPEEYNKWESVDPRVLFFTNPVLVTREGAYIYVRALKTLARQTSTVILALDADVEGEAIAFEVMRIMKSVNPELEFRRAWFSAVTKSDILEAFRKLREPNENLANKAFARMVVDLTIGASFTRILTLSARRNGGVMPRGSFLSYGPCQTPVLYLVVKRELEREQFKKKKYYVLRVRFRSQEGVFTASATFEDQEKAKSALDSVKRTGVGVVVSAEFNAVEVEPPVPLNTVYLESRASLFLNLRPKETLSIAEKLYSFGYISYPRTETTIYPPTLNLRGIASMFTRWEDAGWYVAKVLAKGFTPTRGREDDKAHPPIYPTRSASREEITRRFGEKAWKVYEYVVRHFLATISENAVVERQRVVVKVGELSLQSEGRKLVYAGFYNVYKYSVPKDEPLPYVVEGEEVEVEDAKIEARTTQPPPYLSESELLALMKKYGIGTDATMQEHIHTNIERRYFVVKNKRCIPTPLGRTLALALYETVPELVLPEVRGKMEASLSKIATGERTPEEVVNEMRSEFLEYYDRLVERIDYVSKKIVEGLKMVFQDEKQQARAGSVGEERSRSTRTHRKGKK
ncbi:DNA topoisomerase [Thermofilum pendens]|uniref:DNA topoisomerase n=1 Tax=Thermofilum pendens (strain DSM 2475 / Hrk 5) TaxID=368408 RepID=A1RYK6_THEPD|nr:DNA topoisomerase [Thermofilum pendens]ABL78286.1 DNA topoisomerase [Thermofilum pendens Hrk 5]